ncbi:MAG: hypothetical protein ACOVNU_07500 [Candidatus Kapaibacteriota bacterium]|jgi:hypothetical protein
MKNYIDIIEDIDELNFDDKIKILYYIKDKLDIDYEQFLIIEHEQTKSQVANKVKFAETPEELFQRLSI